MDKQKLLDITRFEKLSNEELSELLWMINKDKYKERPVTILEFINSKEFVAKKWPNVFPIWQETLSEIYPTPFNAPYNEILISAAAGAGKTVTATIGTLYDMYKLGCLKDPCDFYGLSPGTMLIMAVFSATGSTAAVNWQDLTTGIEMCPWLYSRVVDKRGLEKKSGSLTPVEILPGVFIQTGSKFQHSMGKAIFDGLMDEAAFGGNNLAEAQKTYNELSSRMATRFRKFSKTGNLPGHLFLISSPKEAGDFMQFRIETAKKSNSRFTMIKQNISSWDADPRNDSDDKFTVFVGNEFKEPKIYEDNEEPSIDDLDYLIYPPKSYLDNFRMDILGSIMNYGGITTVSDTGLFKSPTVVGDCMILNNPFNMNVIKLPFAKDDVQLMDFLDMSYFKDIRHPECNRFIHIDVAFSSNTIDRYGIAAGYCTLVDRSILKKEGETISDIYETADKMFYIDWALGIEPVQGQEVPLSKVEEFISYLRKKLKYPIGGVSADTFNSKQTLQNLEQQGFDTLSISVDRTRDPYLFLKRLIHNKQILLPKFPELKTELLKLRDNGKKIDHTINGCFTGNTIIKLFGQSDKTIKELAEKGTEYQFWVYACTKEGTIIPAIAYNAHKTKVAMDLVEILLDDLSKITCTPEHLLMLCDGTYLQAVNCLGKLLMTDSKPKRVIEVTRFDCEQDVYDITVPKYNNFTIGCGVVVHNSKDISDAVAGCIWNCSNSKNIVNLTRLTQAVLNPYSVSNMSESERDITERLEYERLKYGYGNGLFKGL